MTAPEALKGRFKHLIEEEMAAFKEDMNRPGLLHTLNTSIGASMSTRTFYPTSEVSYGPLVRIPDIAAREGGYVFKDVTKKDAKREVKRLRKAAKAIEKALRV